VIHHKAKQPPRAKARERAHPAPSVSLPAALDRPPASRVPTLVRGDESGSSSGTPVVGLALSFTLGLSLVLVGLALSPLRLVPSGVRAVVYARREPLLYTASVVYLTTGLSLAIALVLS
jgi:hypothetical protein